MQYYFFLVYLYINQTVFFRQKPTFFLIIHLLRYYLSKLMKMNLIKSLVHGDLIKCSKTKLHSEIEFITKVLIENGYPLDLEQSIVRAKIPQVNKPTLHGLEKYHQFVITVDYVSLSIFVQSTACLHCKTYGGIHSRRCSASSHHFSSEIYNYKCQCNDEYIGRINKRLETRIEQYVPIKIRWGPYEITHTDLNTSGFEKQNNDMICDTSYTRDLFSIGPSLFRLFSEKYCNHIY